jgi:tetratricopeptide (TPR) repeat protein
LNHGCVKSLKAEKRDTPICIKKQHLEKGWACLPGLLAFMIYWRTLAPTLQVANAGEQITAAHVMGISHPTGTPLYLLLMKFWEAVFPFGTIAWEMNLLNALLSAVAIGILSLIILRLSLTWGASRWRGRLLSLCLSLTLAYSQTFWYESTAASSYVLHYFLVILWLALMTRVILERRKEDLKYVCLVTGLALANHILSTVLFALVMWIVLSMAIRKEISARKALSWSLWLLPGLCFYLYIPLRAASDPVINWGDPDSLGRFLRYISRKDYFVMTYVASARDLLEVIVFHAKSFLTESTPLLLILTAVLTIIILVRKTRKGVAGRVHRGADAAFHLALLGISLFVLNEFLLSLHGSHLDLFFLKRYSVPGYIGLFFSCAALITWSLVSCSRRTFAIFAALLALIPAVSLGFHFKMNDRSENTLLRSYVEQVFSHLPVGAALYAEGDNHLFPILYYHLVEGYRADIVLLNPLIGLGDQDKVSLLAKEGRLYTTHYMQTSGPVRCRPAGLVFKIAADDSPLPEIKWRDFTEEELGRVRAPLEKILVTEYYHRRALYHRSRGEYAESLLWVKKMETVAQGYDQTLMLTGFAFANFDMIPEALRYFEAALEINPRNRASRFYPQKYRAGG